MKNLRTKTLLSLFVLLLASPLAQASQDPPGCVQVRSSYKDELKPGAAAEPRFGTGCLFRFNDGSNRLILVTASHVSQGENLSIGPENAPIATQSTILGRKSKNETDLEVIELDPKLTTPVLGSWDPSVGRAFVEPKVAEAWLDGQSSTSFTRKAQGKHYLDMSWEPAGSFALLPSWVRIRPQSAQPGHEEVWGSVSSIGLSTRRFELSPVLATGQLLSSSSTTPGMSGTAILERAYSPNGNILVVRGINSEYMARGLEGSYLSSDRQLAQLITEYSNPATRNGPDSVRWHFRGGLYYRDYGGGIAEVSFSTQKSSATLFSGDGDGNHGGDGDGNHGGDGDGNHGGDGDSNHGGGNKGFTWDPSTSKIGPGFLYHGQAALGVRLNSTPIYGDESLIRVLVDNPELQKSATAILPNDSLVELLKQKVTNSIPSSKSLSGASLNSFTLESKDSTKPAGMTEEITVKDGKIFLHIELASPNKESVDFALDTNGALIGSGNPGFQPIITVKSSLGNGYSFDLTRLFFVNLSQITGMKEMQMAEVPIQPSAKAILPAHEIQEQANAPPILVFRQLKTGTTFLSSFQTIQSVGSTNAEASDSVCHDAASNNPFPSFTGHVEKIMQVLR